MASLLSISSDAKTVKGLIFGYLTGILYMLPGKLCPWATPGCLAGCLNTAGRGKMNSVQAGRARKSRLFAQDRPGFYAQLRRDITAVVRKAEREGMLPVVRLNGTTDLPWEKLGGILQEFPAVQFYDYTKGFARMVEYMTGNMPSNYDLTFSLDPGTEGNYAEALTVARHGGRVAVITQNGIADLKPHKRLIDGDKSDLRFLDPAGIVVLKAKGKLRKSDPHGFKASPKLVRFLAMVHGSAQRRAASQAVTV